MGKCVYPKPLFAGKVILGIDVAENDAKVYFKVSDKLTNGEAFDPAKHRSIIAAESHEVLNIARGLEIYDREGYEKFCEFAKRINPTGFAGTLMFFHRNTDKSTGSGWGIAIKKDSNGTCKISFSINQNGGEAGKVGRSFPVEYPILLKFQLLCVRAAEAAIDNELELEGAKRKELFNIHQEKQAVKARQVPPPGM